MRPLAFGAFAVRASRLGRGPGKFVRTGREEHTVGIVSVVL